MKIPKTIWNYSLETEADRIIQAATQTRQRFYQKYGFLVLPRLIPEKTNTVFLPDLGFSKIKGFWKAMEKTKLDIPMPVAKKIHQEVAQVLVKNQWQLKDRKTEKLKEKLKYEWENKEKSFWKVVFELFPELEKKKIEIEIRPTHFGSISSFNLTGIKKQNLKIKLYIRMDAFSSQIAEAILSSLLKPSLEESNYGWKESEGAIDFLLTHTKLKQVFLNYQPTLKSIRNKENGRLVRESQKYLQQLGIPTGEIFSLKNGQVLIDQKAPIQNLTNSEEKVLKFLVANKNFLCSFDQLGDLIWKDKADELFSIWAISKLVQRIRQKLQANGISPAVIQTQRGRGYVLKD